LLPTDPTARSIAHRKRREVFAVAGATSTDHGHPTAATMDLSGRDAEKLFSRVVHGDAAASDAEHFRVDAGGDGEDESRR